MSVVGVDIGTSSTKGVLVDGEGRIIASAAVPNRTTRPLPGWVEHDAEAVWWRGFLAVVRQLRDAPGGGREEVGAICVSGIGPCLLAADAQAAPLRNAILYGVDTRAGAEIEELNRELGADRILERCGSPLTSQAVGPKLLWLRRHEPEVWARTRRLLMASSLVVHRLTGEYVLDHHSASQCTPMYDLGSSAWIGDWSEVVAPGLPLPRLAWPGEVVGRVGAEAASESGLPPGAAVLAGTIDAWAEALSVGVTAPGDCMVMYGTSMFMVNVAPSARPHPKLWLTNGIVPGELTLAAGMATFGALTEWFSQLVGAPLEVLSGEAAEIPPGGDGLVALPYFAGERTPIFDADARGLLCGLTLRHGRAHLFRALLEAGAFGVRHNLDAMGAAGADPARLVAVGGAAQGPLWRQVVSDVTGRRQEIPEVLIGAAYGDALLAARASGAAGPGTLWSRIEGEVVPSPDPGVRATYNDLYRLYLELYPATEGAAHRLAALGGGAGVTGAEG